MTKDKIVNLPSRHIPQRTCVCCRKTSAKRELVRVVSLADGSVQVDITGKKSGRGAYLCRSKTCWESALETGRLEHALHLSIKDEDKQQLVNFAKGINNISS